MAQDVIAPPLPGCIGEGIGVMAEAEALIARAQAGQDVFVPEAIESMSSPLLVEVDGTLIHEVMEMGSRAVR